MNFLSEQVAAIREHFAVFGELSSVEVEDVENYKADSGQSLNVSSPVRVSYTTRRCAERAMAQGRWFHGQSLNLAWVSISSTNRPPESSALANKTVVPEDESHETTSRGDANGVPEEISVEEQQHVDKANNTDEVLQSPARVL